MHFTKETKQCNHKIQENMAKEVTTPLAGGLRRNIYLNYHFLLAVKDHGRDWKKIEQVVKTRSSTQARSHAQKVLKED